VFDLLVNTLDAGAGELRLVESQEAYAAPRMQFEVARIR
jgi:pyridoxine kinase